jgi:lipopolysaccharide/colanic/teichoic acid biosynthesis glycosyltransferase
MDIFCSAMLLLLLVPGFIITGLAVKLTSPGPILFWQKRVGLNGRFFELPKFRSMVIDAEEKKAGILSLNERKDGIAFKMHNDPRVTAVGRVIRRFSIDETPQLWNVLRGEMSLVGPRPPIPEEVALYSHKERQRLSVKPGLTCLWQIQGRGDLSFTHQVELDLHYIQIKSIWVDIRILLKTIPAVVLGKGAY